MMRPALEIVLIVFLLHQSYRSTAAASIKAATVFSIFRRKGRIGGDIAMMGLQEWWQSNFSQSEREWMADTYAPMGLGKRPLIEGSSNYASKPNSFAHLSGIAPWFNKEGYAHCAVEFAAKALDFYDETMPVLDRHFGLYNLSVVFYRWRDVVPGALDKALAACELCITFHEDAAKALVKNYGWMAKHPCFDRLRIVEEKRGNYERALELCKTAKSAGWIDDWEKHFARIEKKIEKAKKSAGKD